MFERPVVPQAVADPLVESTTIPSEKIVLPEVSSNDRFFIHYAGYPEV